MAYSILIADLFLYRLLILQLKNVSLYRLEGPEGGEKPRYMAVLSTTFRFHLPLVFAPDIKIQHRPTLSFNYLQNSLTLKW